MNKNVVFGILGILLGAAGAYALLDIIRPFPPAPPTPNCPGGLGASDRCIEVAVITVGGQPQIAPIADVTMSAQGAIWWVIKTSGYTFPANGIDFANPGTKLAAPAGTFSGCTPMPPNDQRYKCVNSHPQASPTTPYGYKVTLSVSPAVTPLDPFIVNN